MDSSSLKILDPCGKATSIPPCSCGAPSTLNVSPEGYCTPSCCSSSAFGFFIACPPFLYIRVPYLPSIGIIDCFFAISCFLCITSSSSTAVLFALIPPPMPPTRAPRPSPIGTDRPAVKGARAVPIPAPTLAPLNAPFPAPPAQSLK